MTAVRVPAETDTVKPYPDGALVVHIGPPKTGTTSLQGAFDRARAAILAQGVRYVGPRRHSSRAVLAATAKEAAVSARATPIDMMAFVRRVIFDRPFVRGFRCSTTTADPPRGRRPPSLLFMPCGYGVGLNA